MKSGFAFLTAEFGYSLLEEEYAADRVFENMILRYRNQEAGREVELCAKTGSDYFHCELRRLIGGQPAPYSDRENCISHFEIAMLVEGASYEWEKYSHYASGWEKALESITALLRENPALLLGGGWFDPKQLEDIKTREFVATFKVRPRSLNLVEYLRMQVSYLEDDLGFRLVFSTAELPPHRQEAQIVLRYEREGQWVEIACPDIQNWQWEIRLTSRQKKVMRKVFFDQLEYELQNIPQLLQ